MTQPQTSPGRHRIQGILLDGMVTLREELPPNVVDPATLAELDQCIERLRPMPGLGVTDARARLLALTRALRVLSEDLVPYSKHERLDFRPFPGLLARIEAALRAQETLPPHTG